MGVIQNFSYYLSQIIFIFQLCLLLALPFFKIRHFSLGRTETTVIHFIFGRQNQEIKMQGKEIHGV